MTRYNFYHNIDVYSTSIYKKKPSIYLLFFTFLGHNILHLDMYVEENWIYWVDFEEGEHNGIYRIKPDGTEKQHIIKVIF